MSLLENLNQMHSILSLPQVTLIITNSPQDALEELKIFLNNNFNMGLSGYDGNSIIITADDKRNINIEQIRKLKNLLQQTSTNKNKIAVIHEADCMNINASNATLKLLEEPTPNTYIFLITSKPGNILTTIKSRCHKLRCNYQKATQYSEQYYNLIDGLERDDLFSIIDNNFINQEEFAQACLLLIRNMIKYKAGCEAEENTINLFKRSNSSIFQLIKCYEKNYELIQKATNYDLETKSTSLLILESIYEHLSN